MASYHAAIGTMVGDKFDPDRANVSHFEALSDDHATEKMWLWVKTLPLLLVSSSPTHVRLREVVTAEDRRLVKIWPLPDQSETQTEADRT